MKHKKLLMIILVASLGYVILSVIRSRTPSGMGGCDAHLCWDGPNPNYIRLALRENVSFLIAIIAWIVLIVKVIRGKLAQRRK